MAALVDLVNFQLENAKALSGVLRQETQAISARVSTEIEKLAKEIHILQSKIVKRYAYYRRK